VLYCVLGVIWSVGMTSSSINQSINQSKKNFYSGLGGNRNYKKSHWGKSTEGKTKQVQFRMLFEYIIPQI